MSTVSRSGDAPHRVSQTASDGSANPALVIYRPLVEKLVAALGALVTHQMAYLVAPALGSTAVTTDHGHLPLQWAIVTPAAVAAVAGFIVWQLRSLGFRSDLSARSMAATVAGFFALQELIEGFVAGRSAVATLTLPAVLIGVVLAPLVAWGLVRLLSEVTDLAARFVGPRPVVSFPPAKPALIPVPVRYRSRVAGARSRPRAPPSSRRF